MHAFTDFPDLVIVNPCSLELCHSASLWVVCSLASWTFASQFISSSFALWSFATQLLLELLSIGSPAFTFISQWTLPSQWPLVFAPSLSLSDLVIHRHDFHDCWRDWGASFEEGSCPWAWRCQNLTTGIGFNTSTCFLDWLWSLQDWWIRTWRGLGNEGCLYYNSWDFVDLML